MHPGPWEQPVLVEQVEELGHGDLDDHHHGPDIEILHLHVYQEGMYLAILPTGFGHGRKGHGGADVYFEEGQVGFVHNFQFGQLGHGPGGSLVYALNGLRRWASGAGFSGLVRSVPTP